MKTIHILALTTLATAMAAGTAFAQQPAAQPPTDEPQPQPTRPLTQPTRPMDQPTRPLVQPVRPADQPARPLDQPTRPLVQPTRPRDQYGQPPGMATRDHDNDRTPGYEELNARGDGSVTRADLSAHVQLQERFDDIDTTGDGTLSRVEYETWKSKQKSRDMGRPQD